MVKRCLVISYYFHPNSAIASKRYNLLSSFLSKKLELLDILTIKEKHIPEKDETHIYGGKIYRTGYFPVYKDNAKKITTKIINRVLVKFFPIDRYSGWIIPSLLKGIKIIIKDHIDTIIVTAPPFSQILVGYLLSVIFKIRLIVDYQDPWGVALDGSYTGSMFTEKLILKKAEKLIFNTQITLDNYLKLNLKFGIKDKSSVIPNPYYYKENVSPLYLEKDKKVIIYAGSFYGKRRLKYIFEPLIKLFGNNKLKNNISIHVFGKIHDEDADFIKKLNLTEIVFEHEKIEYSLLTHYLSGADILYLSQGDDHSDCVPYKLIDYLTIGKPILALAPHNSSTYDFMQGLDVGIAADIDDPDSIYNALKELLIDERQFSFTGIEKYSLDNIASTIMEVLQIPSNNKFAEAKIHE